jgi:hypothetical protein
MPRPVVEVHQSILNPVVTVTDPQSQVCLVGLNTKSFTSEASPQSYDFATSWDAPNGNPSVPDAAVEFSLEATSGPIINEDLDLGGGHVISGGISVDLYDVSVVVASTLPGVATSSDSFQNISSPKAVTYLNSNPATQVTDLSIVASPRADYFTKLTLQDNSSGLDLTTGKLADDTELFTPLLNSNTEYQLGTLGGVIAGSTLNLRGIQSGSLFVEPETPASFLSAAILSGTEKLYLYAGGNKVFGDANTAHFDLEHAGTERVNLLSLSEGQFQCDPVNLSLPSTFSHFGFLELSITDTVTVTEDQAGSPIVADSQGDGSVDITLPQNNFLDSDNRVITQASYGANYVAAVNTYSDRVYQLTDSSGLGAASKTNPLALAHLVARANSGTTPVGVLSLDLSPVAGSDKLKSLAQAHAEALRILEASPELYAYVPLTDSLSQLVAYKNSAEAMSVPSKGKFRIVLGASSGAPEFDYIRGTPEAPRNGAVSAAGKLVDSLGGFRRTNGVRVGDSVTVLNSSTGAFEKLGSVTAVSAQELTVTWTGGAPAAAGYGYYVARNIATPQGRGRQIELLTGRLAGIASPRLVMVYPGSVNVSVTGSTIQDLPGYYGSAALAGLVSSLEPHRPKNQIGLAGINGLDNSNFRFSDDEIDQISDAGYFVLIQETRDGAPFCVHQVTTQYGVAQGTQELTELSVVANFDFVSRYFKKILVPYVGTHNIVPSVLGSIRGSLESGIANLRSRNADRIGSPILSGSIEVLRQASYDSGTVEASISVSLPKVLNRIIIEVVSA